MPSGQSTDHHGLSGRGAMRRRRLLATLACSTVPLAGCSGQSGPAKRSTAEPTPPPTVTTITERKPLPDPGDIGTRAAARSFVETHERRYVYNELVGGFGTSQPAVEIEIESTRVAIVSATEGGYYALSTCRGTAQYYDPDGSPSEATRNAASVAHFVGSGSHRRVPFNAYRCREPVVTPSGVESDGPSAARFQIYDFDTPVATDSPEASGHTATVQVTDADGATVLDRTYRTGLPLTVQPGVIRTPGRYRLSVSLADGGSLQHEWSLSDARGPSWWALGVLVTERGDLAVRTLYPNETVGLPADGVCRG